MINVMNSSLNTGSSTQNVTFAYIVLHPTYIQNVSMTRKYHNHTPKTNPRHREEEPQNTHSNKTSIRQQKKATSSLYLVKIITKLERTQSNVYWNRQAQSTHKQWKVH